MSKLIVQYEKYAKASPFNGVCFICHKKFRPGAGFVFHHRMYRGVSYRDFDTRQEYLTQLFPEIKLNPEDFSLLCKKHHFAVERAKLWNEETFNRFIELVEDSR